MSRRRRGARRRGIGLSEGKGQRGKGGWEGVFCFLEVGGGVPGFVDECGFAQNFYGNVCGEKRMDPSKDLFWTQNSRCIGGRGMKRDALCRNLIQKPSLYIYRFGAGREMSEALKKDFFAVPFPNLSYVLVPFSTMQTPIPSPPVVLNRFPKDQRGWFEKSPGDFTSRSWLWK